MLDQSIEPGELILEFGPRPRVTIGKIETAYKDAVDRRFDIAALRRIRIAGQAARGFVNFADAAQDSDAVPALLAMPDRLVAQTPDSALREFFLRRLQFLENDNVRRGFFKSPQQDGQAAVDPIHIVGGDLHAHAVTGPAGSGRPDPNAPDSSMPRASASQARRRYANGWGCRDRAVLPMSAALRSAQKGGSARCRA